MKEKTQKVSNKNQGRKPSTQKLKLGFVNQKTTQNTIFQWLKKKIRKCKESFRVVTQ